MDLFQSQGLLLTEEYELFTQGCGFQVMQEQRPRPDGYNAIADIIAPDDISQFIESIRVAVRNCIDAMPTHEDFVAWNRRAAPMR
jgi:tryptophan 7-halogenase